MTPYLHKLISESYYFENYYSAGVHTNNGIGSTLYGFPALFNKPTMESSSAPYTGLPYYLHKQGYQNLFFVTSNPNYDHMMSFLLGNNFDRVYSLEDYPQEKAVNNFGFGVPDDYLFEYGLETLNKAAENGKPFLAALLTISNHPPYVVPKSFEKSADTDEKRIIAFTDNCLKKFMENAAKQKWYKNTIFVIQGDHGHVLGQSKYDMPLTYNHIPLILHSPLFEDAPKRFTQFCGQIDIFPTVLGLLHIPYTNNSLGIDIFKEKRPYMYFVNDNQLGCLDGNYLYVRNTTTHSDILYDLNKKNIENIMQEKYSIGEKMKEYSVSMMVAADFLIKKKKIK